MPRPVLRDHVAAIAAAALLVVLVAGWWAGLYADAGGRLGWIALVACLPALGALSPRAPRAAAGAALAVSVVVVGALATGRGVGELVGLQADAWADVLRLVPDGLANGDEASTPAVPGEDDAFIALLDVALAALCGAVAWLAVARRRGGAAVVVAGVGLAYRWTVEAPASPVLGGCVALAVMLAALALVGRPGERSRPGRPARAGAVVAGVILAAGLLGANQVQSERGWWNWRDWSVGAAQGEAGSLDLQQRYGQLDWPDTPRVVMQVDTRRPLPLRAAALDLFDGVAFTVDQNQASTSLPTDGRTVQVRTAAPGDPPPVEQRVLLRATETTLVFAGGRLLSVQEPFGRLERADLLRGDAVLVAPALGPDDDYTVRITVPDPDPADLLAATAYDPLEAAPGGTELRAGPAGAPVSVPLWGTGGSQPADAELGDYAGVRALARQVAGDARSPYAAVNRIEAYLRANYAYDEAPPFPPAGSPPLVDFLLGDARRGFCQHFAGSMALMLRTLGVPSRVAVGYTPGSLDPRTGIWTVLDRDAHSWVEVLLPGAGWVPFDPTPGRYAPNRVSVGSPDYAPPPAADPSASEVSPEPVGVPADAVPQRQPESTPAPRPEPPAPAAADPGDSRPDTWLLVAMGALVTLLMLAAVAPVRRAVRRVAGRRRGDERARVAAAVRDMESTLGALGVAPPAHLDAAGRARWLRRECGVDATALYALAERARYTRTGAGAGDGARAWAEAGRVRREVAGRTPRPRRWAASLGLRRAPRANLVR